MECGAAVVEVESRGESPPRASSVVGGVVRAGTWSGDMRRYRAGVTACDSGVAATAEFGAAMA
jgi:hypothetical protein